MLDPNFVKVCVCVQKMGKSFLQYRPWIQKLYTWEHFKQWVNACKPFFFCKPVTLTEYRQGPVTWVASWRSVLLGCLPTWVTADLAFLVEKKFTSPTGQILTATTLTIQSLEQKWMLIMRTTKTHFLFYFSWKSNRFLFRFCSLHSDQRFFPLSLSLYICAINN